MTGRDSPQRRISYRRMSELYQVQPESFHRGVPWCPGLAPARSRPVPRPTYARITQLRSSQVDMWQLVISLRSSCPASGSIQWAELKLPGAPQEHRGVGIQKNCTQNLLGEHSWSLPCYGVRCPGCGLAYGSGCGILRHSWSQIRSGDQAPRERGAFASASLLRHADFRV